MGWKIFADHWDLIGYISTSWVSDRVKTKKNSKKTCYVRQATHNSTSSLCLLFLKKSLRTRAGKTNLTNNGQVYIYIPKGGYINNIHDPQCLKWAVCNRVLSCLLSKLQTQTGIFQSTGSKLKRIQSGISKLYVYIIIHRKHTFFQLVSWTRAVFRCDISFVRRQSCCIFPAPAFILFLHPQW